MKTWWLAAALLVGFVGCASENKPDIDATGTVAGQMMWGGGNCQKSGSEPFMIFVAKIDSYNYNITTNTVGASIGGNVVCGPEYCQIQFFKQWSGANSESYSLDGTLSLDGDTNAITGNGKYDSFDAAGSCEQMVTYTATLQ